MNKIIKIFFNLLVVIVLVSCKPEPIVVTSIEITSPALKTEYCINEPLDTTGLEVTASMENGKREIVTNWTTEFDNTIEGDSIPVIIKYAGTEASYIVSIDKHIWKNGEIVCQKCKNAYDLYETPVDSETGADATSTSKYIYFGVFPKTVLPEGSTVTVDETDSVTMGANTYYKGSDGNYYAKVKEKAYGTKYKYSDDTQVKESKANSYRYFKVEPIKWKVLTTDYNGKALLHAEEILTANVPYYNYNSYENTRTVGSDTNIYPNNYKYSQIRAYLNGLDYYYDQSSTSTVKKTYYTGKGFLQTAFTAIAQSKIAETVVDNSKETTGYSESSTYAATYACENTTDKIFLLSQNEISKLYNFAAYTSRGKKEITIIVTTDYAKANHAFQSSTDGYGGFWWLRSPYYSYSYYARYVGYDGYVYNYNLVNRTENGLVPALSISL